MYAWPDVDLAALRSHRTARTADEMSRHRLDHLLLTGADHIRYATDFRAHLTNEPDWFVALVDAEGATDVWAPYVDETVDAPDPALPHLLRMHPLPSWSPATGNPGVWVRAVAAGLRARGARRVGHDAVDAQLLAGLRAELPDVELIAVSAELHRMRQVKHPIEVQLLAAACEVNTGALEAALRVGQVGASDHDVLAEAMRYQQSAGAEFVTHSVCNLRKGSGDWFAHGARFREGDPFFLDIGCYGVGGYASDAARTGFVGEPHPAVARAYAHLEEAHRLAQASAAPGVKASAVHRAVNDYLTGQGLGRTPYAVGHGIGLRICELPTVYRPDLMDDDVVLEAGHVIALEPETSVEVDGRLVVLKIEDNFVVEANGLRQLTVSPAPPA
jgi:Xaa-Pro aminopeptidase